MNDIIKAELVDEIDIQELKTDEYSKATKYTETLEKTNEELLAERKVPDREVAKEVSTTETSIDLAMAALAKATSIKLLKLEKFLSKIEDELFNDDTLSSMSKGDLMQLYAQTRMMKTDAFKMLKEIKKDIDFSALEMDIMAMNAKGTTSNLNESVNELLDKIINDEDFLEKAKEAQKS